jgi:hypothetical protein
LSRDDDDQWIDRTVSDPEFADAVWSGKAPLDDAPTWYPRVVRMLDAAHRRRPPDDAELARSREAWSELSGGLDRRERRQRRRRLIVAGAVAAGVALAVGGAAAAMEGGLAELPFFGSQPAVGDVHDDADPAGQASTVTVPTGDAQTSVSRRRPAGAGTPSPRGRRPGPLPSACQPQATPSPGCSDRSEQVGGGPADPSPAPSAAGSCSPQGGADAGDAPSDPPPCATGAASSEPARGVRGRDRAPESAAGSNP